MIAIQLPAALLPQMLLLPLPFSPVHVQEIRLFLVVATVGTESQHIVNLYELFPFRAKQLMHKVIGAIKHG